VTRNGGGSHIDAKFSAARQGTTTNHIQYDATAS
jgi:hypothetical protein